MTFQPGSRFHLVLAGGGHAVLWIAIGAVALVLLLVLSRYELRLVSRRAGLTLLGTRLLAVFVLLAALFEPIAERRYEEKIRGRVVLGVDLSESMATADPVSTADDAGSSSSEPVPAPCAGRSLGVCWKETGIRRSLPITASRAWALRAMPSRERPRRWPGLWRIPPVQAIRQRSSPIGPAFWPGHFRGTTPGRSSASCLLTDGRQNVPGGPGARGRSTGGAGHSDLSRDDRLDQFRPRTWRSRR